MYYSTSKFLLHNIFYQNVQMNGLSNNNSFLVLNIFMFILVSIFIIILAYFTTRFVSQRFNQKGYSKNITIIERLSMGVDKSFLLIKLGNCYYFLYVSKNQVQLIDKVENLDIKKHDIKPNYSLEDILSKLKKE